MKHIKNARTDFPMFSGDKPPIYLDSAATAQKPSAVIDAVSEFYRTANANPYRGVYGLSEQVTERYEHARQTVASFINAEPSEVIFTRGTTEGVNFIADVWASKVVGPGDEILLTRAEHHANLLPWQRVAERTGAKLRFIELDTNTFTLQYPGDQPLITEKTKVVAVTAHSNVLGSVWESNDVLKQLINDAHAVGARVVLDCAQLIPYERIDVWDLNVDFAVFSGHKMLAPTGVGVLYIKKELHDAVEPYQLGGSMVYSAGYEKSTWDKAPQKFEAGTPPVAQAIGLEAAITYLNQFKPEDMRVHHARLTNLFLDGLAKIEGVRVLGNEERMRREGHLVSFNIDGVHAHDIASFLGMQGIAVRAGHHCAQPLAEYLGVVASVRASFYLYTTETEVEALLSGLQKAQQHLKR